MSRQSKDPVQKCHSDPGGGGAPPSTSGLVGTSAKRILSRRIQNAPSASNIPATRKCVLTLDGYSYVIGEFSSLRE